MAIRHGRSKRKASGGRYHNYRKKKSCDLGREPTSTKVGERKAKKVKKRAGKIKTILLNCNIANVFDGKKNHKVKIQTILEFLLKDEGPSYP